MEKESLDSVMLRVPAEEAKERHAIEQLRLAEQRIADANKLTQNVPTPPTPRPETPNDKAVKYLRDRMIEASGLLLSRGIPPNIQSTQSTGWIVAGTEVMLREEITRPGAQHHYGGGSYQGTVEFDPDIPTGRYRDLGTRYEGLAILRESPTVWIYRKDPPERHRPYGDHQLVVDHRLSPSNLLDEEPLYTHNLRLERYYRMVYFWPVDLDGEAVRKRKKEEFDRQIAAIRDGRRTGGWPPKQEPRDYDDMNQKIDLRVGRWVLDAIQYASITAERGRAAPPPPPPPKRRYLRRKI